MKSCLIQIRKGNTVIFKDAIGIDFFVKIEDIILTPNGVNDPGLIALIYASTEDNRIISATSDKFRPTEEGYEEFFPSVHHCKIGDDIGKKYQITVYDRDKRINIIDKTITDPVRANTFYDQLWRKYISDNYNVKIKRL